MKYKLTEVESTTELVVDARGAYGWGFSIQDEHGPMVSFVYLDQADAEQARSLIEGAIKNAAMIS